MCGAEERRRETPDGKGGSKRDWLCWDKFEENDCVVENPGGMSRLEVAALWEDDGEDD